jgi:hypothetical protein
LRAVRRGRIYDNVPWWLLTGGLSLNFQALSETSSEGQESASNMFAQPRIKKTPLPPPKKRKASHAIEEITFDKDARAEYLTGFHKRKQARIKHAQEVAQQKAREERIEMRKQVCFTLWISA